MGLKTASEHLYKKIYNYLFYHLIYIYIYIYIYLYIYIYIYLWVCVCVCVYIYIYIYIYISCHAASTDILSPLLPTFIASGRSSGLYPVSSHSWGMYVRAARPAFAWPYAGVHWSISLMSSSLLLQQCPSCLFFLAWIVFVMGGRWQENIFSRTQGIIYS